MMMNSRKIHNGGGGGRTNNTTVLLLLTFLASMVSSSATAQGGGMGMGGMMLGGSYEPPPQPQMFTSPYDKFGNEFSLVDAGTNRQPRFFHAPAIRDQPGFSYRDDIAWLLEASTEDAATLFAMLGMPMMGNSNNNNDLGSISGSWGFRGAMESITKVDTSNPAYLETDATMNELEMDLDFLMFQIHCAKTSTKTIAGPECYDLLKLVGETETIVQDSQGNLISVVNFDGMELTATELQQLQSVTPTNSNQEGVPNGGGAATGSLQGKFQAQQFAASSHYDKHSDLMKFLPDHPVQPGDEWDDHIDMIDTWGVIFNGKSYLKGYYPCSSSENDNECAIFTMEGIAHVDEDWLATMLYGQTAAGMGGMDDDIAGNDDDLLDTDWLQISDATVFNTMVWDTVDDIPRWTQTNVSLTVTLNFDDTDMMMMDGMGVPPAGASGSSKMDPLVIPLNMTFQIVSDIKSKPDPSATTPTEVSSAATSSSTASASSTQKSSSGGGGSSGSKFKWFVFLAFGGVVGVLYVRKRMGTYYAPTLVRGTRPLYDGLSNTDGTGDYESPLAAGGIIGGSSELPTIS